MPIHPCYYSLVVLRMYFRTCYYPELLFKCTPLMQRFKISTQPKSANYPPEKIDYSIHRSINTPHQDKHYNSIYNSLLCTHTCTICTYVPSTFKYTLYAYLLVVVRLQPSKQHLPQSKDVFITAAPMAMSHMMLYYLQAEELDMPISGEVYKVQYMYKEL